MPNRAPAAPPAGITDEVSPSELTTLRRAMLRWYRAHRRDLPWRTPPTAPGNRQTKRLPDPYHVLVSEAMLQQTQVATVIDYYNRFRATFPTVNDLAQADEQQVLKLWQGLGYYRRARHLHAAARVIVAKHRGRVPDNADDLRALPGVGRYTAGAVASIAYGRRRPAVDGNIARVLARWHAIRSPINAPATIRRLWTLAETALPKTHPGDFNQALMELGALVCTPQAPKCTDCPVRKHCRSYAQGITDSIPEPALRKRALRVEHHTLAIERRGKYLFQQRPERGLWSKMWQLPTLEAPQTTPTPTALCDWAHELLGLELTKPKLLTRFAHQTTHRHITFHLWRMTPSPGRLRPGRGSWRALDELDQLPLPNPYSKCVRHLLDDQATHSTTKPRRQRATENPSHELIA